MKSINLENKLLYANESFLNEGKKRTFEKKTKSQNSNKWMNYYYIQMIENYVKMTSSLMFRIF